MTDRPTDAEVVLDAPMYAVAGSLAVAENSKRAAPGRPFRPGQSGNPGGRPKGLAALIRQQTGDGAELVGFALKVLRSSRQDPRLRLQACEWLADRGFGKAVQSHEVTGADGEAITFTLRLGERESDG